MRLLKKNYLEELKKAKESVSAGEAPQVKEIAANTHGHPLLVGEFNNDVSNVHQGSQESWYSGKCSCGLQLLKVS